METKPKGDSDYALRLAFRKSKDGGKDHPMPRPLHLDYFPKYYPNKPTNEWKFNKPIPGENTKILIKEYQTIKKKTDKIKKYNHFKMNYYGCDLTRKY